MQPTGSPGTGFYKTIDSRHNSSPRCSPANLPRPRRGKIFAKFNPTLIALQTYDYAVCANLIKMGSVELV